MSKLVSILVLCMLSNMVKAQNSPPTSVMQVLNKAGNNRKELLKAVQYYSQKRGDSLKLKAMYFLIANMDIHYSSSYYLVDTKGNKVPFNELSYASFGEAVKAYQELKKSKGRLRPVPVKYRDIDTITASYLISNIESAFKFWGAASNKNLGFTNFCEYILPYRISVEPLQNWRKEYETRFSATLGNNNKIALASATTKLSDNINTWFTCIYDFEKRNEPLPRLGAMQALQRKKGYCEDIADLSVFALRSHGIGASTDIIPFWATSSGGHTINWAVNENNERTSFDVLLKSENNKVLIREPGKVFRQTYSKQNNALAYRVEQSKIPNGILQQSNIIDVTDEYWKTASFTTHLKDVSNKDSIVYACVFNYLKWQPIWWGKKSNASTVRFDKMSKGVVYLPKYYKNQKFEVAGYPIALGYNNTLELKPDTLNKHSITIEEQEHYLLFQAGKKYKLFYWDNQWRPIATKMVKQKSRTLKFDQVPNNALLILLPENKTNKERPFIVTKDNKRIWF